MTETAREHVISLMVCSLTEKNSNDETEVNFKNLTSIASTLLTALSENCCAVCCPLTVQSFCTCAIRGQEEIMLTTAASQMINPQVLKT